MSQQILNPESFVFLFIFWTKCLPETWTNGAGFTRVATALSESSSIHSEALYNLAKDMSAIGLEPMPYGILEPEPYKDEPLAEESQSLLQAVGDLFTFNSGSGPKPKP